MKLTTLIASLVPTAALVAAQSGILTLPPGSPVQPGQLVPFSYDAHIDKCITSFNYTVWMYTTDPGTTLFSSKREGRGVYLGRFSEPAFPVNPSPPNRPPTQIRIPDLSAWPGGWGTGIEASNLPVWLGVMEEWRSCVPQEGDTISVYTTELLYNATTTA